MNRSLDVVKYSVALVLWERGLIPEFISRIYLINVDTIGHTLLGYGYIFNGYIFKGG